MMNWMAGLSTIGSISFGCALVAGRNLVPNPAAGMTALWIVKFFFIYSLLHIVSETRIQIDILYFSLANLR